MWGMSPSTVAPAAAAWPPPPRRAQTELAFRSSGSVRREILQEPSFRSRMVTPVLTPSTWPTKAAMSSASRSSAWRVSIIWRLMAAMAISPPSWNSRDSVSMLSSRSRLKLLVRKWRLFSSAVGMPVSMRAAATRWVPAEVFPYTKQPQSVDTAT